MDTPTHEESNDNTDDEPQESPGEEMKSTSAEDPSIESVKLAGNQPNEDSKPSSQPVHDSKTSKDDPSDQNSSEKNSDEHEKQTQPETSSKKPKSPLKRWDIDTIDLES